METLSDILDKYLTTDLKQIIASNPRKKEGATKIKIRPVLIKEELYYQVSSFIGTKVFHENHKREDILARISPSLQTAFKQIQVITREETITILSSKKGHQSISRKKVKTVMPANLSHNRVKRYLIEEGTPVPFLVDLGVMNAEGKVHARQQDKFRQINRFLEMVLDVEKELPTDQPLTILDFGCGKSYLTFALYYYMTVLKKRRVHMIGLDLKEDVIDACNKLAKQYGYDGLAFLTGDIKDYEGYDKVDMVVTLHACDTATDYALYKAMQWDAKVILSVPCCQHELNQVLKNETLEAMLSYGIIKERFCALATDVIRAELLKSVGYETQILEFIDIENTPKNLLLRAVKKAGQAPGKSDAFVRFQSFLGQELTLQRLMKEEGI